MSGGQARSTETKVRGFRCEEDSREVTEILREAREASRWSVDELREFASHFGVTAYVNQDGNEITGIVFGRRVMDEGEILNLAIRMEGRRQGRGRMLVEHLLEGFRRSGVSRVFLEVRESNSGAIAFYEKLGFRTTGVRKDYYHEPKESALVMERQLKESTV